MVPDQMISERNRALERTHRVCPKCYEKEQMITEYREVLSQTEAKKKLRQGLMSHRLIQAVKYEDSAEQQKLKQNAYRKLLDEVQKQKEESDGFLAHKEIDPQRGL